MFFPGKKKKKPKNNKNNKLLRLKTIKTTFYIDIVENKRYNVNRNNKNQKLQGGN